MYLKFILIAVIYNLCHLFIEINGQCPTNTNNCSQCISESFECFWCTDLNFEPKERCGTYESLKSIRMCQNMTGYNYSSNIDVFKNDKFSEKTGESSDNIIQLKPQKVRIKLRPKSKVNIGISYKRAVDYPMDLYFLMDLSCTMKKYKQTLSNVAKKLKETITEVTKNFKLGFGSYVDKPIMPFSAFKIEPAYCDKETGDPPYSFRHIQSLTSDDKLFADEVNKTNTSGNADSPEGTLDALMQVMVCDKQIGWRPHSDKIIVVATDEEYHYAGDGKLAGILTPNDGLCHLKKNIDSNTIDYTHFNITDYPSMHHIAEVARKKGFNIVFSVTNKNDPVWIKNVYGILKNIIGDNARVADLNNDDDKTTNLIREVYDRISKTVELSIDSTNEYFDINITAECKPGNKIKTNKCGFKGFTEIKFEAIIKLKSCPLDEKLWKQKFTISIANNKKEVLEIDLEMLCKCQCDNKPVFNSVQCSSEGTLACGKCRQCNPRRSGNKCECDLDTVKDPEIAKKQCKNFSNDTSFCSGKGDCNKCNICECKPGYKGRFCEIDAFKCYQNPNLECNGKGQCNDLGECKCNERYINDESGGLCKCYNVSTNCKNTTSDEICSNNGKCVCNHCICNDKSSKGSHCQYCPKCHFDTIEFCNKTRDCVPEICQLVYGSKEKCTQKCEHIVMKNVTKFNSTNDNFIKECKSPTQNETCAVKYELEFTVNEKSGITSFGVSKPIIECQSRTDPIFLASIVVSSIILGGLALLLLWKLLTEIWDRREFAKFQKELSQANWQESENPLYKQAKSTFTNPMFGLRERAQKRLTRLTERISRRFDINP